MTAMAHIMFDTFRFVESLRKSGMPDAQAKALMEAQREVFAEALDSNLATKSDMKHLEKRVSKLETQMQFVIWMIGIVIAGVGALVLKAFF